MSGLNISPEQLVELLRTAQGLTAVQDPQVSAPVPAPVEQGRQDQTPHENRSDSLLTRGSSPLENRSQRRAPVLPVVEVLPQIPEVDLTLDEEMIIIEDDQDQDDL